METISNTNLTNIITITKLYNYVFTSNNINILNISSSNSNIINKQYIKELLSSSLNRIKSICYKSVILREKRQELRDDIDDLERMYVRADNLDISESGKNTGGKENDVELRHLKIIKLKEELASLTTQSLQLDKSLSDNKEMFRNIFDEVLTDTQATIMKLFYIDCWTTLKIATELYYTRDYIRQIKNRSINKITRILLEYNNYNTKNNSNLV